MIPSPIPKMVPYAYLCHITHTLELKLYVPVAGFACRTIDAKIAGAKRGWDAATLSPTVSEQLLALLAPTRPSIQPHTLRQPNNQPPQAATTCTFLAVLELAKTESVQSILDSSCQLRPESILPALFGGQGSRSLLPGRALQVFPLNLLHTTLSFEHPYGIMMIMT